MLGSHGIRTDLALEATERFTEENVEVRGVEVTEDYNGFTTESADAFQNFRNFRIIGKFFDNLIENVFRTEEHRQAN